VNSFSKVVNRFVVTFAVSKTLKNCDVVLSHLIMLSYCMNIFIGYNGKKLENISMPIFILIK